MSGPEGKAYLSCAKVDIADLMSALGVIAEVAQRRSQVSFLPYPDIQGCIIAELNELGWGHVWNRLRNC